MGSEDIAWKISADQKMDMINPHPPSPTLASPHPSHLSTPFLIDQSGSLHLKFIIGGCVITLSQETDFSNLTLLQPPPFFPTSFPLKAHTEKAFARDDASTQFDYVFNCAAETKYGQSDEVYDEKVYQLTLSVAKEAAKRKIKVFLELSTAQIYEADKVSVWRGWRGGINFK